MGSVGATGANVFLFFVRPMPLTFGINGRPVERTTERFRTRIGTVLGDMGRGCTAPPNPGAARDAARTRRKPGPHFRIRLYTGQYNRENVLPVPVFGKSTRELSGRTERNLGFV